MIRGNIDRIFKSIIAFNMRNDLQAIPHSDEFLKEMELLFGFSSKEVEIVIEILKDSHKILVMDVQREEKTRNIPLIQGYVDADIVTVSKLKGIFSGYLEDEYERDSGEDLSADLIVKKLLPRMQYINNTPMGILLNKVMMLTDFEFLLERDYKEYFDEYKENSLLVQIDLKKDLIQNILNEKGGAKLELSEEEKSSSDKVLNKRAMDSPKYDDFSEASSFKSVNKLLSIYGVEFFFRVNLRKKKFAYLQEVLDTGVFDRKKDLMLLKEMLKVIKSNLVLNKDLMEYYDEIFSLDRALAKAITFCKK